MIVSLQLSCLFLVLMMLECRSFFYLLPPILQSVENVKQLLSLSQPFMRATAGNPSITNERPRKRDSAGIVNNRNIVSHEKDRIIDIGHRNVRMISCLLLSTGFLSLNPITAFAEPSLSSFAEHSSLAIESVHMRSSTPSDRTVNAGHSSLPSSFSSSIFFSLPSFPLLSTSVKSTPLSSSLLSSSLPSSSLSTTLTLSNALLQKPEIQIQNPHVSGIQTQVNLPGNVREMIAKSASNIPGFGQPDVFYPKNLLGSWNVAQTYTDIIGENKNLYITEMLSKKMLSQEKEKEKENGKEKAEILPYTIQYQCNFIDIKGNIVRDRSYCETNKFNALLSSQEKEVAKEVEKGRRISALGTWDYSNPNILSIQLSNGMTIGTKVTKRAVETKLPIGTFGFSEYSQIFESTSSSSVPKIFGMRVLERLRGIESSEISGVERMYIYDQNTLDLKEKPQTVLKSNFVMTKIKEL